MYLLCVNWLDNRFYSAQIIIFYKYLFISHFILIWSKNSLLCLISIILYRWIRFPQAKWINFGIFITKLFNFCFQISRKYVRMNEMLRASILFDVPTNWILYELQAIVCFAVCMSATLVSSQFFGSYNNNFGGFGLNSIDGGDFGGANTFGSLNSRPNIRDPRQNRGKNKNTLP